MGHTPVVNRTMSWYVRIMTSTCKCCYVAPYYVHLPAEIASDVSFKMKYDSRQLYFFFLTGQKRQLAHNTYAGTTLVRMPSAARLACV